MAIERITVYSLYVMIWLTQNIYCREEFCDPSKPVVKICTEDTLSMRTSAQIDTVKASKFEQNSCKCTLSPTRGDVRFGNFEYYRKPSPNMEFKINNILLDKEDARKTYMNVAGNADLFFTTTENATDGACLIVRSKDGDSKFNITCTTRTTKVTTDPSTSTSMKDVTYSKTFIFPTSTEIITDSTEQQHSVAEHEKKTSLLFTSTESITASTEQQHAATENEKTSMFSASTEIITASTEQQHAATENEETSIFSASTEILTDLTEQYLETAENGKDNSFIIPVVVSVSGCVCLVIVVAGILYRRRKMSSRRVSTKRNSKAETKNESDYYMTENPMYNMTDTPQNTQTSENEYSFVEHENQEDGITSNQYESLPDSPVGTRISSKPSSQDQEYDYTVCSSASRKYKTADQKQNKTEVKQGKSLPNDKTNVDETVYDRTDKVAKQFNSLNEYSHLPNTVSQKAADDTYNTLGNCYKT